MKAVYVIRENGEKASWANVGVAFVNRYCYLDILLDALPTSGKLHVRDFNSQETSPPR